MVLAVIGINIIPLLAGAGFASLALSLGFQSLIRDYIGGFFLLIDSHIRVGDWVQVLTVTGQVERISMRAIYLRDQGGQQHMVPNGDIRLLTNMSRDWGRATVDLAVPFDSDFNHLFEVLNQVTQDFADSPEIKALLVEKPEVKGWMGIQPGSVSVQITAKSVADKKDVVERKLREKAVRALIENNIHLM